MYYVISTNFKNKVWAIDAYIERRARGKSSYAEFSFESEASF
jgi:hypothetical protein